jgi:isoquinoline 1-oxidoreductase beta subunit
MSTQPEIVNPSRRRFLVNAAAGGLTLAFYIPFTNDARAERRNSEVNAWVVVSEDDTVTIRIARSEMGQGTLTGLAQLVAEELECDWSKVITEYPTPGQNLARQRIWGNFSTGGSRGIRESQDYVRRGGAAARLMLMTAASKAWEVPASELAVSKGVITHEQSGRATTFGKVAFAASKLPVPKDIALKDRKDWKVIGKRLARLDTVDKVNGKQRFGVDIKLPGMLNAAIKDCPVFGGKVLSFDDGPIKERKGVRKVVTVGDSAVAVIADTWWQAKTALDAMSIEWDFGAHASASSAAFEKTLDNALFAQDAIIGNKQGNALGRIAASAKQLEAVYSYPHQHHATMEPMNAIARYTPERCEVWTPTQNGEAALAAVAEASGLPASRCEVYKMHLGGGFGRRGAIHDWVRQAVKIAQQLPGVPVKLLWSREEDMLHGRFHRAPYADRRAINSCRRRASEHPRRS